MIEASTRIVCPICNQLLGEIPALMMVDIVMLMPTELGEFVNFMNTTIAHMVAAHTAGLTDVSLALLYTMLEDRGMVKDYDTFVRMFASDPLV